MVKEVSFTEEDGSITLWRYDSRITKNGPVEVISDYNPKENKTIFTVQEPKKVSRRKNSSKPPSETPEPVRMDDIRKPEEKMLKTKQKYLNPETGKMVGYVRAKNLGIV